MKEQGKKNVPSLDVEIDFEKVGDKIVGGASDLDDISVFSIGSFSSYETKC